MIRWLGVLLLISLCVSSMHGLVNLHVGYMIPQHRFDNAYDDVYSCGIEIRGWGEDEYGSEICFDYMYAENETYRDKTFGVMDYYYRIMPLTTTLLVRAWTGNSFPYIGLGSGYYMHKEYAEWRGEASSGSSSSDSCSFGYHYVFGYQSTFFRIQLKYLVTTFAFNKNVHYWNDDSTIDIAGYHLTFGFTF